MTYLLCWLAFAAFILAIIKYDRKKNGGM